MSFFKNVGVGIDAHNKVFIDLANNCLAKELPFIVIDDRCYITNSDTFVIAKDGYSISRREIYTATNEYHYILSAGHICYLSKFVRTAKGTILKEVTSIHIYNENTLNNILKLKGLDQTLENVITEFDSWANEWY